MSKKKETTLKTFLEDKCETNYSYHMPGHKNNLEKFPYLQIPIGKMDYTEINGLDNLQDPKDIIKKDMDRISAIWGARKSYISVNGSTCSLIASIFALTKPGDHVLVQRNCHKSIYNGITLRGLIPSYFEPEYIEEFNIYGSVNPSVIEEALEKDSKINLVIVTSPSYEGIISDIGSISKIVHKHNALLLVDEAHGAHLGLYDGFEESSIKEGADVVCQSLHKTMPVINPCSLIHVVSDRVNLDLIQKYLNQFQTSSPSYIALYTISSMLYYLETQSGHIFDYEKKEMEILGNRLSMYKNLKVLNFNTHYDKNKVYKFDRTKILTKINNIYEEDLESYILVNDIDPEYVNGDTSLFMLGPGDDVDSLGALIKCLDGMENRYPGSNSSNIHKLTYMHKKKFNPYEIELLNTEYIKIEHSLGRVSAEKIYNYPPGSPIIVEGEIIDEEFISDLTYGKNNKLNIISESGSLKNGVILCVKE